jgi:disulfide bond formation protein DsbB
MLDSRNSTAAAALAVAAVAIASALFIESIGYEPCVLCLRQRYPYYVALPVLAAAIGFGMAGSRFAGWSRGMLQIARFCFSISFVLAGYHVGVEQGLWEGPSSCVTRALDMSSLDAFAAQISNTMMVSCNTPTFTLLGFSLAWWNLAVSFLIHAILAHGIHGGTRTRTQRA